MIVADYQTNRFPTWCPGCGDFGIWGALKTSWVKMGWNPWDFAIVFGIGCSGNMADFIKVYGFHSLHGRALPNAVGLKIANHKLPVVVVAGDGDCYGEGGNHFIHTCRGNHDISLVVHDNRVYGLTTGQVAPTATQGFKSKSTPDGIIEVRINPLALAITQGATFVAQGFAGDIPHLTQLLIDSYNHRGFSVVNVLQPCVTFNKINTYMYYREHTYKLDSSHNPQDKISALTKVMDDERIPLGILYKEERKTYEQSLNQIATNTLVEKPYNLNLNSLLNEFK
ncbi:2-oxoacid:ferredoxin oxidoreductase subunit beta [Candidatus Gottesmanbacteria bacterium]|nr:2-oxoacid:ferredoxin oxidoreductase subunit beta [Candidatus Gottesmanbacteria bacterium]